MLKIANRINLPLTETSGLDSYDMSKNKDHFINYGKKITYQYNSRGFRDAEWPEDLSDVVWCLGDSFTVGIGQPYEETWPKILEKRTGKRCLNLGEDECSNDTIALRTKTITEQYQPKIIIIMWSYLQRRRKNNINVKHDKDDFGLGKDVTNFLKNLELINNLNCKIIQTIIPNPFLRAEENTIKKILSKLNPLTKNLIFIPQLDYARDYHHFDIKTSDLVTELITKKITAIDKSSK